MLTYKKPDPYSRHFQLVLCHMEYIELMLHGKTSRVMSEQLQQLFLIIGDMLPQQHDVILSPLLGQMPGHSDSCNRF